MVLQGSVNEVLRALTVCVPAQDLVHNCLIQLLDRKEREKGRGDEGQKG